VDGFTRALLLLRSSIAVSTASVVTPAPPTAGRKVYILASVAFVAPAFCFWETRAQVRTRSIAATGFTKQSATRICNNVRATRASKLCVTATTGGHACTAAINCASACISASLPVSRSATTTAAPAVSSVAPCSARLPDTTVSSIALDAPNVARTLRSNSASAVSTTTRVRLESMLSPWPRCMTSTDLAYFTGAADWTTVGPTGVVLFWLFAPCW